MERKYTLRLENFHKNMEDCIRKVWKELSEDQKEMAETVLLEAWEEEDREGFQYTDNQIIASFLSNQILYPCYDAVFKAIFLNDANYVLLKDFISCTIFQSKRSISKLEVVSSEPVISSVDGKIFRCDIQCVR